MATSTNGVNGKLAMWIPIAAVIGAAAGAAVALLFAPKEGKASRQYIREKATQIKDQAADTAKRVGERIPFRKRAEEESGVTI